jgi:hemerythrin
MATEWSPALSIGVPQVDAQHQELFKQVEGLIQAARQRDRSQIEPTLGFLGRYAFAHFRDEEALMAETGYPEADAANHRDAHERFRAQLRELSAEFDERGATALVSLTLHNWVAEWLRRHVGGMDQTLGRWLRDHGRQ